METFFYFILNNLFFLTISAFTQIHSLHTAIHLSYIQTSLSCSVTYSIFSYNISLHTVTYFSLQTLSHSDFQLTHSHTLLFYHSFFAHSFTYSLPHTPHASSSPSVIPHTHTLYILQQFSRSSTQLSVSASPSPLPEPNPGLL